MAGSIHHRRIESYPRMCLLIPLTPKKEKEERRKALVFLNLEKSTQVRTHTNLTNPSLAYDDSKQSLATIFAHCPPVSQGPRHFVLGRSRPRPPIAQASQRKRRKRTSSSHTLHSCTPRLFLSCFFFSFFFFFFRYFNSQRSLVQREIISSICFSAAYQSVRARQINSHPPGVPGGLS